MPHLRPPLLVLVLVRHSVHLQTVALQGAALGEGFFAKVTFIRPHSCNNGKCQVNANANIIQMPHGPV